MGYTHYMRMKRDGPQEKWTEAVMAARKVIEASPVALDVRFSDTAIYADAVEEPHETLVVLTTLAHQDEQAHQRGLIPDDEFFLFCKTARKPYDVVVTAAYATLQEIGGPECVLVSSDGESDEWEAGVGLASRVLDRQIPVPAMVIAPEEWMA